MKRKDKIANLTQEMLDECTSYAGVLRYLHIANSSSAIQEVKQVIEQKGLNVDHFKGHGWNKGNFDYSRFKNGNAVKTSDCKKALISLRGHKCEECGLTIWKDQKIPLEVHHIDGNTLNNDLKNLQLLCPNCHALTDNFRNKGHKETIKVSDEELIEAIKVTPNIRQALLKVGLAPKGGNYHRVYELKAKYNL